MIEISVDTTYPAFAALDPISLKKVSVSIGPTGMNTMFFSYDAYPLNFQTEGDAGVNQASLAVSVRRSLRFSNEAFAVFGNVNVTDYSSSRLGTLLSDYVKRGVLIVAKDGLPLTPAQVLTFTP